MSSQHGPPTGERASSLAAGIVVFGPDRARLRALVSAVLPCVERLFIFVNGLADPELREELDRQNGVELLDSPTNFGVGDALNIIVLGAALAGHSHVLLFDQDSAPDAEMPSRLLALAEALAFAGQTPAVIGPTLIGPDEASYKSPRYFPRRGPEHAGAKPVQFLPTSGSLVSIEAFRAVGTFRGDYFIDAIDLEWCFRAWARGYSCWCATHVKMVHTVGEGAYRALGVSTPHQRDFRYETYVRNTVYGFRLPHIPISWKIRQAGYLVVQLFVVGLGSGFRPSLMRRVARGIVHGVLGRLGPPDGAVLT